LDLNAKILFVEDNRVNQIVATIPVQGLLVAIAHDGDEVVKLIQNNGYEHVFVDLQMPGMDGTAGKKFKVLTTYVFKNVLIIALTASAMI
jgi:CheY-like chemotaxis protein